MKKKTYNKPDMTLDDFKEFIDKTYRCKYAGKYTLDESSWVDKDTPMRIHCREHGWFLRKPSDFGQGFVCPFESNAMRNNIEWQKQAFVEKAQMKYGDRLEYHMEDYVDCKHDIRITCKKHGDFYTTPDKHLVHDNGGCPKCFSEVAHDNFAKETSQFIEESKAIWGEGTFDYSKTVYTNRNNSVTLLCRKHNIQFTQTAYKHLLHHEQCPECLRESNRDRNLMSTDEFISRCSKIHNNKYDYSLVDSKHRDVDGTVTIICPVHGPFKQNPAYHINGHGCPRCGRVISKAEDEIIDYIKSLSPNEEIIHGAFGIIGRKQLDIYLPNKKIAIEYNDILWHSEKFGRDKFYHLNKLEACNKEGIKLIQVFEDEWLEHKDIVLSKIGHLLHCNQYKKKIRAHKCVVSVIDKSEAESFLNVNHIQGYTANTVTIGTTFNGELVGVCCFKKENVEGNWELVRMVTKNGYLCHGVCSKMFKYFVSVYNPSIIKSFADRRWTLNEKSNVYTNLGFILESTTQPDYSYVLGDKRVHKFNFRKQILHKKYGLPLTMTETEMVKELGIDKIWNCGLYKYLWKNDSSSN